MIDLTIIVMVISIFSVMYIVCKREPKRYFCGQKYEGIPTTIIQNGKPVLKPIIRGNHSSNPPKEVIQPSRPNPPAKKIIK